MRNNEIEPVLSRLGENLCDRVRCDILEFVNIEREIFSIRLGDIRPRKRRHQNLPHHDHTKQMAIYFSEFSLRKIKEDDFLLIHKRTKIKRTLLLSNNGAHRGLKAIIAGAGGAAHLPGMLAAKTTVPVLGVPVQSRALNGMDSLLSIVQMPKGIPVTNFVIDEAGAANAGLFAVALLAGADAVLAEALEAFRSKQTQTVLDMKLEG